MVLVVEGKAPKIPTKGYVEFLCHQSQLWSWVDTKVLEALGDA